MSCILTSGLEILYVKWQLDVIQQYSKRCFTVEILYVQQQVNIITTLLQEMFSRVTDLYMGAVNISLPRNSKSLQLKYILDARYYAIQRNV